MEQELKPVKQNNISVLITDDHPLFRKAIRRLLMNIPFVSKIEEADNGKEAIEILEKVHFDIILLDLMMTVMDGEEAAKIIRKRFPEVKIIILTMSDSKAMMVELLTHGVTGYVLKSTDEEELTHAILAVTEGSAYLSKEVSQVWTEFMEDRARNDIKRRKTEIEKNELSEREEEIIRMVCKQMSTKEIAEKLSLSENTVQSHRRNIMIKLQTDNVVGIAIYAIKNGIYIP